jgi:hypothetical protein
MLKAVGLQQCQRNDDYLDLLQIILPPGIEKLKQLDASQSWGDQSEME